MKLTEQIIPGHNQRFFWRNKAPQTAVSAPESLKRFAALGEVSQDELRTMKNLGTTVDIAAGTSLIRAGSIGRQFVLVLEGHLAVKRDGNVVADLGPGQIAGEMALLTGQRCSADVVATTDVVLLVLNEREFGYVLEECPGISRIILGTAIDRLALAS